MPARRPHPLVLAATLALLASCACALDARAATTRYVDCSAPTSGDGSRLAPWNDLATANAAPLGPGDRLLLRRGTVCAGPLAPIAEGSEQQPVRIGAYGSGARPRVDATSEDAVLLRNTSFTIVRDLEVTNAGPEARRRGVHILADGQLVRGLTVRDLYIHDVDGDLAKDGFGSGGIQGDVANGGRFDGLLIEKNRIEDVSRSGIFLPIGGGTRPRSGEPWPEASTNVVVRGNRLTRLAGDGIVSLGTVGAVLEENVVSTGNLRGMSIYSGTPVCNAGIWTFSANDTVIQRNEVFDMRFNGCDGNGFDVDYEQDGTIVQYNYSHDNEGGFILLCTDDRPRTAQVRFNLSVNDAWAVAQSPCAFPRIGGFDGIRFHNNTFIGPNPLLSFQNLRSDSLLDTQNLDFRNNLFVADPPIARPFPCGAGCSNNLFFGMPAQGTDAITANPQLVAPSRSGNGRRRVGMGFRLRRGSPAIGAGVEVPDAVTQDYFGRTFDPAQPSIGMHQP